MKKVLLALFSLLLSALAGTAVGNCLTDTTQADFQAGVVSSVDLTTSPGNVQLTSSGGGGGATIDQQNTTFTADVGERCSLIPNNNQWCGQTFTAGKSGSLSRIDLNLFCAGCTTQPPSIVISVRATSGGLPTGSDLASTTLTITDYSGSQAWYSANFVTAPTNVTTGTQYAIVIRPSTALARGAVALSDTANSSGTIGNDVYAGGAVVFSTTSGSSWAIETGPKPSVDGGFKTYIGGSGGGYTSSGNLTSSLKDSNPAAGYTPSWNSLAWTNSVPSGTAVKFQAAASNSSTGPFSFVGPDGSAASYFTASNADLSQFNGNRFLKYRSYLSTSSGSSTPVLNDATVCYTNTLSNGADLSITNTDGVTAATAGGSVTYTIKASNAGPTGASPATVADTFPSTLTCSWTCAGVGGSSCKASGNGSINDTTVNLPSGGSVTYTATCSISGAATGTLANTATVTSASITDTNTSNNSATDTDTIGGRADLSISVSDGATAEVPGTSVTYTITASNAGPDAVSRATVSDTFQAPLTSCHWTCAGAAGGTCSSLGTGNINDNTVTLPVGGTATYTATCTLPTSASGTLSNTATVADPTGVTDPSPGNNSSTDSEALTPQVDLSITINDGQTSTTAGATGITYTIVAQNAGPSDAPSSKVADNFPSTLTCNWTCAGASGGTCPSSGSGDVSATVGLPKGARTTLTATCSLASSATGNLVNTATVSPAAGTTDTSTANNSATDSDSILIRPDVAISMDDGVDMVKIGDVVNYVIRLTNAGPSDAAVSVTDTLPPQLSNPSWVCSATGGATCGKSSGNNALSASATVPVGGVATYTYTATVQSDDAGDSFVNTARSSVTNGSDPNGNNNTVSETNTIVIFENDFGPEPGALNVAESTGSGSMTAQFGVDAGLLNTLGPAPVTVASGRSANGRTLFRLQLMRLGGDIAMRALTTIDNTVFSDVSPWQVVNLKQHVLGLQWQSASARGDDGYLRTGPATQQALIAANNAQERLTQLQVSVENDIPWLVLIEP
jgi:uncharacterized repeat protein (TIGR01451 family)